MPRTDAAGAPMTDTPRFDDVLRQALNGLSNDDVRIFFDYFEELKRQARQYLRGKARTLPGSSAVVQSALLSMLCDLSLQQIPLADVDEHGYPALWPLLLKYIERHCDKWNKYYQAKKRQGAEVPLAPGRGSADDSPSLDPADYRAPAAAEKDFMSALEALEASLTPEERLVLEGRLKDETLEAIAAKIGRAESTVSNRLSRIRALLEGA